VRQRRHIGGWGGAPFPLLGLLGLLALLVMTLAGCALPQPFGGVPAQNCVSQRQGSLGVEGGIVVALAAFDPTAADHTSALYGVRANDGALAWSCASTTYAGWNDARLVNGVVYAIAGTEFPKEGPLKTRTHGVYAIRPRDGHQLWSYSFQAGSTSQLAFDGGMLYVSAITDDGASSHSNLYAIHTSNGALAWAESFSEMLGQPIIVDHHLVTVITTTRGQELRALNESDGATLWTDPLASGAYLGSWLSLNGALYFSDGDALTALDGASGATRWTQAGFSNISSQLFSAQGAILFSANTNVFAFDQTSGAMRWSAVVADKPTLVQVSDQAAYAVTQGPDSLPDHLFALNLSTGDVLWQRDTPMSGAITPTADAGAYLTISTGAQKLADVEALDQRGALRWTYTGTSPYSGVALIPMGDAVFCVWQGLQARVSPLTLTSVTRLRASDGVAQWTTQLPASNAFPLPPLLIS
jgi:outer membrane protein assembly factor BamB